MLPTPEDKEGDSKHPDRPCTVCPHCGSPLWLRLVSRPAVARPADRKITALIPRDRKTGRWQKGTAPTEIIIRADSDAPTRILRIDPCQP